eukprot:scaffold167927_cov32-Tisochrysis_lutea.AAC.2
MRCRLERLTPRCDVMDGHPCSMLGRPTQSFRGAFNLSQPLFVHSPSSQPSTRGRRRLRPERHRARRHGRLADESSWPTTAWGKDKDWSRRVTRCVCVQHSQVRSLVRHIVERTLKAMCWSTCAVPETAS